MTDKEINSLKNKRVNIATKIKDWYSKGKNAKEYAIKYNELTRILNENGCNLTITKPYFNADWWDDNYTESILQPTVDVKACKIKTEKECIQECTQRTNTIELVDNKIKDINYYTICLAWSNKDTQCASCTINLIKNCFNDLGLKEITNDCYQFGEGAENLIKYRYIGNDESFQIIKTFAQSILDNNNENSAAIYGKKINF